jgi:AbrB family looped-hinge helix DNA binding protein
MFYCGLTALQAYPPMATAKALTTTVSTKGQIILPKAIRQQRRWHSGTRLVVEDTEDGVLLKPAPLFAPTDPKDVFGLLRHRGPPKTLEQMQAGIAREARRRHARNRY